MAKTQARKTGSRRRQTTAEPRTSKVANAKRLLKSLPQAKAGKRRQKGLTKVTAHGRSAEIAGANNGDKLSDPERAITSCGSIISEEHFIVENVYPSQTTLEWTKRKVEVCNPRLNHQLYFHDTEIEDVDNVETSSRVVRENGIYYAYNEVDSVVKVPAKITEQYLAPSFNSDRPPVEDFPEHLRWPQDCFRADLNEQCDGRYHDHQRLPKGKECDCVVPVWSQYPEDSFKLCFINEQKGLGIRATRPFRTGELLGEYLGEVRVQDDCVRSQAYMFEWVTTNAPSLGLEIDAEEVGNWTRFVNHDCMVNNVTYEQVRVGRMLRIVLRARSHIGTGEEILADYGEKYWTGKHGPCPCAGKGSKPCKDAWKMCERKRKRESARQKKRDRAFKLRKTAAKKMEPKGKVSQDSTDVHQPAYDAASARQKRLKTNNETTPGKTQAAPRRSGRRRIPKVRSD